MTCTSMTNFFLFQLSLKDKLGAQTSKQGKWMNS